MRFLIVGTGRCGTGWASAALNAAGARCGHETVFSTRTHAWPDDLEGDSSFAATPYIREFKPRVAHLVRHPVNVVASWLTTPVFFDECGCHPDDPRIHRRVDFGAMQQVWLPGLDDDPDPLGRAISYVVRMTGWIESFDVESFRLEDITTDPEAFRRFASVLVDRPVDVDAAMRIGVVNEAAVAPSVTWDDIVTSRPDKATELEGLAERYGYCV